MESVGDCISKELGLDKRKERYNGKVCLGQILVDFEYLSFHPSQRPATVKGLGKTAKDGCCSLGAR